MKCTQKIQRYVSREAAKKKEQKYFTPRRALRTYGQARTPKVRHAKGTHLRKRSSRVKGQKLSSGIVAECKRFVAHKCFYIF